LVARGQCGASANAFSEPAGLQLLSGGQLTAAELARQTLQLLKESPASNSVLADLPLEFLAPESKANPARVAVIYSGDGGWAQIDRDLGKFLVAQGIPVIGLDTLQYFWREKAPAAAAADLRRILEAADGLYPGRKVLLIGYSYGAEVMPFLVNRLPPPLGERIEALFLLNPGLQVEFEVHFTDWLNLSVLAGGRPILPEARALQVPRKICIFGEDESEVVLCPKLPQPAFTVMTLPGGHHFGGDYESLGRLMLSQLQ
jgi:type IV secretory pathway VirJ component